MHNSHITSARLRKIVTRGIVATTALAAVSGAVVPATAAEQPAKASAQAGAVGTTAEQRVEAASKVDFDPPSEVLLLSDYDFIHVLWQKARDAGERMATVRTAAEEAMLSSKPEDHVRFITAGIGEARKTDQKRERDKAEADRAARLAKSQALLAVGIPSSPELLELSDDNFVRAIVRHPASGPEVRSAGARALAGDAPDWHEFIVNGAREAHKRDVANELKEIEEKNRQEAERKRQLAARKNVAALFRVTPSEAMLGLADDNFIRELLRAAPTDVKGTELFSAAQKALLSSDPAAWKKYIDAGADEAYKRDDENRRKKIAEENRQLARRIQAAAENGGVNPNLVAAAKKALAGTDEDVATLLKDENQHRARRQSFMSSYVTDIGWYIRRNAADGDKVFIAPMSHGFKQADREDATWVIVPALANNPGCFSFESVSKPGYYLRNEHQGENVLVAGDDGSAEFRSDASWCPRKGFNGYGKSFELASKPGVWLRNFQGRLYGMTQYGTDFNQDSTWLVIEPYAD